MDLNRLKQLKLADPFRPFYLLLNDGRRFFIRQSYEFAVAPDGSRVAVSGSESVVLLRLENVRDVDMSVAAVK
jgi:hypothetical protein